MDATSTDLIVYAGQINRQGYDSICEVLQRRKSEKAVLVLATPGGDAHAGFRIARALQHSYGSFNALVPRYCKSAGTLILIGANKIYLADVSELGPLDVQIKKGDELVGMSSGLDIFQAVNYLQGQVMTGFRTYLVELNQDLGLSTKLASDISTRLSLGMLEPIAGQIDPMKLAEMQRATEIAFAYGNRLNANSKNLRADGLARLVTGYPSHGFVIDRKEAKTLFIEVHEPVDLLLQFSDGLRAQMDPDIDSKIPKVNILTVPFLFAGDVHDPKPPSAAASSGGHSGGESTLDGASTADAAAAPDAKPEQGLPATVDGPPPADTTADQ